MKKIYLIVIAMLLAAGSIFAAEQRTAPGAATQPFTYANILAHFKAAGFRATEVQKRCTIFFEGEWRSSRIYNYCLIVVENSDRDVQVTFYLTDAHEMNWVTEFVDAPFFARNETEELFDLVNRDRDVRRKRVGRFLVDYHHWRPRHAEIVVFSFVPVR